MFFLSETLDSKPKKTKKTKKQIFRQSWQAGGRLAQDLQKIVFLFVFLVWNLVFRLEKHWFSGGLEPENIGFTKQKLVFWCTGA